MNEARLTEIALFSISLSHQEKARNLCGGAGRVETGLGAHADLPILAGRLVAVA